MTGGSMFHFKTHLKWRSIKIIGLFAAALTIPIAFNSCEGFKASPADGLDKRSLSAPIQNLEAFALSQNEIKLTYTLSEVGDFSFTILRDDQYIDSTMNTTFYDEGLEAGTTYIYKVYPTDIKTGEEFSAATITVSTLEGPLPPSSNNTLSDKYSRDNDMKTDPSVVMVSGFESSDISQEGWSQSSYGKGSTQHLRNSSFAYEGSGYLEGKISDLTSGSGTARLRYWLDSPKDQLYVRFYVYLPTNTVGPHHWVGFRANSSKTGVWQGQAGYRPPGDTAFAGRLDLNHDLELFTYTYWHEMRCHETLGEGNCYGNIFPNKIRPKLNHDKWECVEFMMKANSPGLNDGEQAFWLNNKLGYHYKTNSPLVGKWLHTKFIEPGYEDSWGTYATYNRTEMSFPGYNFRTNNSVKLNLFDLEYYMQANTLKSEIKTHKLYYDNVVIATERIGCR